ncbi:hypothetical protein C810_03488 [Lachnospiraceae bacterium A2]|nr:hypothetical protein C810_03488 [Lachnospiraceae bacterium A2]
MDNQMADMPEAEFKTAGKTPADSQTADMPETELPAGMACQKPGADTGHRHGHTHSHTQTQAVLNRMSRAIGHMEAVKRMVEDGRDCSEVLIQIAAVRSAINNIGKIILEDHISHCIVDAVEHGDGQALEDLKHAIEKFIK